MDNRAPRILVVDDDAVSRRIAPSYLEQAGFEVGIAPNGPDALAFAAEWKPTLILLDLADSLAGGVELLRRLRDFEPTRALPVVVATALHGDEAVERALSNGADDFIRKPYRAVELIARVRAQVRLRATLRELAQKEHDAQVIAELTHALTSSLDMREILFTVVRRVGEAMRVARCSIVVAPEASDVGFVVAASDDPNIRNLPIDLDRYPEIQQVLQTRRPLTIDDATSHPMFWEVRVHVSATRYPSLTLVPITCDDRAMGVLFLRADDRRGPLSEREVTFCETVADATAIALRNARLLQRLRDETREEAQARTEAERRLRLLERYADLFVSAADGMVVIDPSGAVLFANPRATEITGYTENEMRTRPVQGVVLPEDEPVVAGLRTAFAEGRYPVNIDVRVRRRDGVLRTLSLSTSPALREEHAVLLTFRDVTDDRATARELASTKEFLSSLIESSPDAIIAARLDGTIALFNSAAERILGYSRADVIGKKSVTELYPSGYARDVMRRIRAAPERRIESVRSEVVASSGERIPIHLSAALVTEHGAEVASVGMFTDLRERLKIEETVAQMQRQLAQTEKQMIVAELAGAAAHELNQPLTAIQGYAELMQKKAEPESPTARGAAVILRESERMAEIVRKIGRITRYETKHYVGGTKIIDLERSSDASDVGTPEEGK
jgi:PAS domain S-box-containing protein